MKADYIEMEIDPALHDLVANKDNIKRAISEAKGPTEALPGILPDKVSLYENLIIDTTNNKYVKFEEFKRCFEKDSIVYLVNADLSYISGDITSAFIITDLLLYFEKANIHGSILVVSKDLSINTSTIHSSYILYTAHVRCRFTHNQIWNVVFRGIAPKKRYNFESINLDFYYTTALDLKLVYMNTIDLYIDKSDIELYAKRTVIGDYKINQSDLKAPNGIVFKGEYNYRQQRINQSNISAFLDNIEINNATILRSHIKSEDISIINSSIGIGCDIDSQNILFTNTVCHLGSPKGIDFTAYKLVKYFDLSVSHVVSNFGILKLTIPKDAQILNTVSTQCRASKAIPELLYDCNSGEVVDVKPDIIKISSLYRDFPYTMGEEIAVDNFDTSNNKCSTGIHFVYNLADLSEIMYIYPDALAKIAKAEGIQ